LLCKFIFVAIIVAVQFSLNALKVLQNIA